MKRRVDKVWGSENFFRGFVTCYVTTVVAEGDYFLVNFGQFFLFTQRPFFQAKFASKFGLKALDFLVKISFLGFALLRPF